MVVIPLAEKDLEVAEYSISSVRRFLQHPIDRIVSPSQPSSSIEHLCRRQQIEYIDERVVLSPSVLNFNYCVGGENCNGWIRQQLLKLSVSSYLDGENYLILDADTIFARNLSFFEGSKQIIWAADDLVEGYHAFTEAMIGAVRRHPYSFAAHCMLFQRCFLLELQKTIERRFNINWIEAMLQNIRTETTAGMSEYELYAHFLLKYHREAFVSRYWYNKKVDIRSEFFDEQANALGQRFNFLSDHAKNRS